MADRDARTIRNDEVYPKLFGRIRRGPFALSAALFAERFGQPEATLDPAWLTYGVYEYAPAVGRPFWLYVTTGNSDPWPAGEEDESGLSGAGVEFLLATKTAGDWAIAQLQTMLAFDILLSAGRFDGRAPLQPGDWMPLKAGIDGGDSALRNLLVSIPNGLPAGFDLPSGKVQFLTFTGVSDPEVALMQQTGPGVLMQLLAARAGFPVTDPRRASAA